MSSIIIAGIGTNVGKSIFASILVEWLCADYWKPLQSGDLNYTDTIAVRSLVSNRHSAFHLETYKLTMPISPHAAAKYDGIEISLNNFKIPFNNQNGIIELAGGIMTPLNARETNLDLINQFNLPVILVSRNYLGSINHTLLSVELLKRNNVNIVGLVFNGGSNINSENYILDYTGLPCIARIDHYENMNQKVIKNLVQKHNQELQNSLHEYFTI